VQSSELRIAPIASCVRRSSFRPQSSRLDGSITGLLSRRGNRKSAIRVMATAAAAAVNQAMTQATEAPRAAMTVMQIALASQQAPAASISADLPAGPGVCQGSDTGTPPDASASAVILPRGRMPDSRPALKLDVVTAPPPASSSHAGARPTQQSAPRTPGCVDLE
jgi:hypothetical protein